MFKKIKELSYKITDLIVSKEDKDYYFCQYSIKGFLHATLYWIISLILGLMFGYIIYVPFGILLLIEIRKFCGGIHGKTDMQCLILSVFFFNIVSSSSILLCYYYVLFFVLSLCSLTGLNSIPKYTSTATRHKIERQRTIKRNYILMLLGYIFVNLIMVILTYFGVIDLSKFSIMISIALIINRFSLSDFAFWLIDKINL